MMATIQNVLITPKQPGCLRPFDMSRDLGAVADLVEQCFRGTIDPDGQRYLRHMRSVAKNSRFMRWAGSVGEPNTLPLTGFVWEEAGRLVGNLSMIPFSHNGRRLYLIANVAVHPDFRRRGIARTMTAAAVEHALRRGAPAAWLQVREENEAAVTLYRSMGFHERARRSTWHNWYEKGSPNDWRLQAEGHGFQVGPRRHEHWSQHASWVERLYPPDLSWHFSLDKTALRPGLLAGAVRLLTGSFYNHWDLTGNGRLLGAVSRQRSTSFADHLWLGLPAEFDDKAVEVLLKYARHQVHPRRPLTLDFPAGLAASPIQASGFQLHQTLIWMSVGLS